MFQLSAQIYPGQALGFLVLGATLHDVLTRLKSEPQRFPRLDLTFQYAAPTIEPIVLGLQSNGLRLRFDGPEQRLRLIEVVDFTKNKLTYNNKDVFKPVTSISHGQPPAENMTGPTFRHIYNRLIGPTFPGEYIEPATDTEMGLYILSYPGVAFTFPVRSSTWSPGMDPVSLLSSSASQPASSMAIFHGESWPSSRVTLFTKVLDPVKDYAHLFKGREAVAEEIGMVNIHGAGRLELLRRHKDNFWIFLGETTPQTLIAELGPPDAIYRKSEQPMSIHKTNPASEAPSQARANQTYTYGQDDSTDTDQSSAHSATDESDDGSGDSEMAGSVSGECFYNYFYHGFDVLISTSAALPLQPPTKQAHVQNYQERMTAVNASSRLVAAKVILHGNVPGSYPFNRHRRCRWKIDYLSGNDQVVNSESSFENVEQRLHEEWKSIYAGSEEGKQRQRGMVLKRDWGDSPGSSCELLGGWEESADGLRKGLGNSEDNGFNTTLFGFPGLVFEVLNNGCVSALTVF